MHRRPWLWLLLAAVYGTAAGGERTPILVELFTSEGCASCPPADALAARLHAEQPFEGVDIVILSLHVDSWNDLGWTDPFSSAAASARQRAYAETFGLKSAYTPQVVVDGTEELVGGDGPAVLRAIRTAAARPKARVVLRAVESTRGRPVDTMRYEVVVSDLGRVGRDGAVDVVLAILEDGLDVDVSAGENAGRRLRHDGVVREMHVVGRIGAAADGARLATPDLVLRSRWKRERIRVVAFVQERRTGRVVGVSPSRTPPA